LKKFEASQSTLLNPFRAIDVTYVNID